MTAITLYSDRARLAPVTGAKQQAPSGGFGEGVGEAAQRMGGQIAGYARAEDAYQARVEEAGVMELDTEMADRAREIEQPYLASRGRNAIDGRPAADEAWDALATEFADRTSSPRQRQMMAAQIAARRNRWSSQRDNHLSTQTEAWQVGVENASIATASRDAATLPVGSAERSDAYLALGARLDDKARRQGWSRQERAEAGFEMFSGVHIATVQQLVLEQPQQALEYLEENREGIDPTKFATLMTSTRDQAWTFEADIAARGFLDEADAEVEEVPVADGAEAPGTYTVTAPVSTRMGSRFGARRGRQHRGVDYPVPVNTPVQASLPGIVHLRNDPDGYGRYVEIDHGEGRTTRYAHLGSYAVRDGQRVTQGQVIAMSGGARGADGAGNSEGPHVHYEFRVNGAAVDPAGVIGTEARARGGAGGGSAQPRGAAFTTQEDVQEWAARQAGGDPRRLPYFERAGSAELARRRSARGDNESEVERAADEWRARNPAADFSTAPANIRQGVSPGRRASEAQRDQSRRDGESSETRALGNTTYLALLDEATLSPEAFRSRDLDSYRGIITEGQYAQLRGVERDMAAAPAEAAAAAAPTVQQRLSEVSNMLNTAARQMRIETAPSKMTPQDAERMAHANRYLLDFSNAVFARTGAPPTQEQLAGAIGAALMPVRTADGEVVPASSVVGQQVTGAMNRTERRNIIAQLRAGGVQNPTEEQIVTAHRLLLQRGELALPVGTYRR